MLKQEIDDYNDFNISNEEIKHNIKTGLYKISDKRGRSKVWDCFGLIKNEQGMDISNFVACKICKNVYKYSKNALSNLTKHKCYITAKHEAAEELIEANEECKKACTEFVTEWIYTDIRPYSIIEDEGLKSFSRLMLSLGSKFGPNIDVDTLLPHPSTICKYIEKRYQIHFADLKDEISEIRNIGYALTFDIWAENYLKISYIPLTIHYVMNGEYKTKLLGMKSMKGLTNTSSNIKQKIENLLNEFNCSLSDPLVMVTNRASNMKAAFKKHENIFCINHLISNSIDKCVKMSPQIDEIVTASSKLIKYFKKSGLNCGLMTSLKSFPSTRWNRVYFMLSSIKSNFSEIQSTLQEKNLTENYTLLQEHHLEELVNILKPFNDASQELECDSYSTLHLVHVNIQYLKTACSTNNDEPIFIKEFKQKLCDTLTSLVEANLSIYHKLALFLFPPANQLSQFCLEVQNEITNKCKSLMTSYVNDSYIPVQTEKNNSSRLFTLFESYASPLRVSADSKINIIENEIIKYKSTTVSLHDNFNVLKWWNDHKNEFPYLYKLSCRVLAIPSSSAPSERVLSIARTLITDKKTQIGGANSKYINEIMFININSKDKDIELGDDSKTEFNV